jgi:hypothetical protein
MEMTMATMGRLIKNFDMAIYLFSPFSGTGGFSSAFPEGALVASDPVLKGFGVTGISFFTF